MSSITVGVSPAATRAKIRQAAFDEKPTV